MSVPLNASPPPLLAPPAADPPGRGSPAERASRPRRRGARLLGKYREIVIAVAFFLMFDLAVLVLNFYTSFQIDQDTVAINLAGRQRYVSQRIARTLLELDAARAAGQPYRPETLAELRNGARLFQLSQGAFVAGGVVPGGDGKPVYLAAVESSRGRELLGQVEALWTPYHEALQPLLAGDGFTAAQLGAALGYSQAQNLRLLDTANDFVTETQRIGASRAAVLRMVQAGGIVLALLNFLFILFKFIRRMKASDEAVEAANEENRQILSAVQEGLFLLTPQMQLGTQISRSVSRMFGRSVRAGEDFIEVLRPLVSDKVLEDARSYVELLFSPHVREHLVQGINPLTEVELQVRDRLGQRQLRHLAFQFRRVQQDDGTTGHLLVTVQDVSARVELEQRLGAERQKAQREFGLLVKALEIEPDTLRGFVERSEAALLEVNDVLRGISAGSGEREVARGLDRMYRSIHAFKGEAAMLGLELLAGTAHQFESVLRSLREADAPRGEALLGIPVPLEELLNRLQALKRLLQRAPAARDGAESAERLAQRLDALARRIARDGGKRVRLDARLDGFEALPTATRVSLVNVAIQLVRNAVVHGVEPPALRQAARKPPEGLVTVSLETRQDEGGIALVVQDDGGGLPMARIRRRLVELGWFTPAQVEEMGDAQVGNQIFRPGFSTAEQADEHAGRGVGLDVVSQQVRALGARLVLSSRPGAGTAFRVCVTI
ncbi:ATP-binding protein [Caldimonas tepidiphila]|uniref:ATP-binding protein n=1 Tax=Caldimonas tepidiphila TaxID=2315841 RepID=UPI000E5B06CA|nr:ATP-binding protein [Caldimonas tepidiphila]